MADGDRQVWISEAQLDQEGSFCDPNSGHHYENVGAFQAELEIQRADTNEEEVIVLDAPADPGDSYGVDQRFNVFLTEQDSQGVYTPRRHQPGS